MRFTHENVTYALDFIRKTEQVYVRHGNDEEGKRAFALVDTKHPSTEARLLRVEKGKKVHEWEVIASAKVICYYKDSVHHDKFSLEDGRQWALKKLTPKVPRAMRAAVWSTYLQRGHAKLVDSEPTLALGTTVS